jgi:protein-S-isoprenylcysteine O-methyltransferase Ste14
MVAWIQKALDALALVYALWFFPAPIFWLIIHPAIHFWRRFGNRSFWIAAPVWAGCGAALVIARHRLFAERVGCNALTTLIGLGLIGLALRIGHGVHRDLGLKRLGGLPEVSPGRYQGGVVRTGIYARLRHPRYVEYVLTFVGLGLLTGAVGIFLLAMVTVLLYYIVAPLEERELREHYGAEYEAYAQAVPRFVPRLRRKIQLGPPPGGAAG